MFSPLLCLDERLLAGSHKRPLNVRNRASAAAAFVARADDGSRPELVIRDSFIEGPGLMQAADQPAPAAARHLLLLPGL